ncbi:hypothetical protein B296_00014961 [Ensete ventricosum]|uniref:Uncharacterized protein n=1 Tax=Ensete ventricosum TaxID=4639 RepID=A0A427AFA1_ENSVE|nr:hypothetical protein B296_00014961 [Ensete ventricosum]
MQRARSNPHLKHVARIHFSMPKATKPRRRRRPLRLPLRILSLSIDDSMAVAPAASTLRSSFLSSPRHPKLSLSSKLPVSRRLPVSYPRVRALDLDQNTVRSSLPPLRLGLHDGRWLLTPRFLCFRLSPSPWGSPSGIIRSLASPVTDPVLVSPHILSLEIENELGIDGIGAFSEQCRFCTGSGKITVVLGGDETDVSQCINCEGVGTLTCTTCQGSGIQPRYLDRR